MGEITKMAMSIMFAVFIVGMFSTALYMESTDENKTEFVDYSERYDQSDINNANLSYDNTNDSVTNFELIANNMQNKIAQAQKDVQEGGVLEAFGLVTSLTMDIFNLMLAVLFEGANFIAGVVLNINELPTPWNYFSIFSAFAVALIVVYMALKIVAVIMKWDL